VSNRTLIEINHDYGFRIEDQPQRFVEDLGAYLAGASRANADELERWGVRVLSMRHHSGDYIIDGTPDGFPVRHMAPTPKGGA
jgi:hypothetical protein